jgi:crotonobetainyl-CoA:carnitine CoA-transferase CaiB-like acyl-CoA transferase
MIQGMSGLMSITGRADSEPGSGPQKVGVAVVDLASGLYATIAIQAALLQRARTDRGQYIDLALLDVAVALLANQGMNFLATGAPPPRRGNAHPSIVPYQDFATQDGWIMLAIGNDTQFASFCRCAARESWSRDARFATNQQRVVHREVLVPMLAGLMRTRGTRDWLAALEAAGVPCGPINDVAELFADPQALARGLRVQMPGGAGAAGAAAPPVPGIASPLRLSAAPVSYALPPPPLGAHTREVLGRLLGLEAAQLDALAAQGVI